MKIALHSSSLGEITLEDAISKVSEFGYSYIELAADISNTPHFMAHRATVAQQIYLEKQLERRSIELSAIDIGGWDLPLCISNSNEDYRLKAVCNVRKVIQVANNLGCNLITSHFWGFNGNQQKYEKDKCTQALKKSLSDLSPLLVEKAVKLAFMPHPGGLLEESNPSIDLIKEIAIPEVGYLYGTGHGSIMAQYNQSQSDMIDYASDTLFHVSISDSPDQWRIVAPHEVKAHEHSSIGSGDVNFTEVIASLKAAGYGGFLSLHLISETDRIDTAAVNSRILLEEFITV